MSLPTLDDLTFELPSPELPGLEGTLVVCDVRNIPGDDARLSVISKIREAWLEQVGEPEDQPDGDPYAIGVGIFLDGALVGWGALRDVEVEPTGASSANVCGRLVAGAGAPGLAEAIVANVNGQTLPAGGFLITLCILP